MNAPQFLETAQGRRLAYHWTPGNGPAIVFCHGLRSDMQGTKAVFIENWAIREGRPFLRFDCSGHGQSSGTFEDGAIGDWLEDALAILDALTTGKILLVGSSMGGWLSLLLARERPERIGGLVTIAAAPDFTEDGIWQALTGLQQAELMDRGSVTVPSDYGDPLVVTRRLIEDGRAHLVLRSPLHLPFPVRSLQGAADLDVEMSVALRLLDHATGEDIRLVLVKNADHRFSGQSELDLIARTIGDVLSEVSS